MSFGTGIANPKSNLIGFDENRFDEKTGRTSFHTRCFVFMPACIVQIYPLISHPPVGERQNTPTKGRMPFLYSGIGTDIVMGTGVGT